MKRLHRIMLETIILVVLLGAFMVIFYRTVILPSSASNEKAVYAGAFQSDDSTEIPENRDPKILRETDSSNPDDDDTELFPVPVVELTSDDSLEIPEDWDPNILRQLDYSNLDDDPLRLHTHAQDIGFEMLPKDYLSLLYNEQYDKLLALVKERISNITLASLADDVRNPAGFAVDYRDYLSLLALAFELKGDLRTAARFHHVLYGQNSPERTWSSFRTAYAELKSGKSRLMTTQTGLFIDICSTVAHDSVTPSIDSVLQDMEEEKKNGIKSIRVGDVPVSPFSSCYGRVLEAYRFRDRCARIVNPRLHYACGDDAQKLVFLSRKSYSVFLNFMEEHYETYYGLSTIHHNSDSDRDIDRAMEYFRDLARLPY